MLQQFANSKWINSILLFFIGLLSFSLLYLGLFTHPAPDTNCYLSIARDVLDGYVPTYDVSTYYTPFAYYILAFFLNFFGDSYNIAVITVFLFSIGNVFLLFYLFWARLELPLKWCLLFICIYLFTLFQFTAFYVLLEPFQVFFALISFVILTAPRTTIYKVAFSGVFMGISIMCKQYSALFAIGVCLWMILKFYKKDISFTFLLKNGIIWSLGILLPYIFFILFTKATLHNSLVSFGFIGDSATSYIEYKPSFFKIGIYEILKVIILNLLSFIPFLLYPICRKYIEIKNEIISITDGIFLIGLVSFGSIYVRQYAHYFQLIIPWSLMLWVVLFFYFFKKGGIKDKKVGLRKLVIICFFISLPSVIYMSPKLIYFNIKTNVIDKKSYRIDFTKEALQVFREGSAVYVRGNSILYSSCSYRNPTHNYSFLSPNEMIIENKVPNVIDNVIIPKQPTLIFNPHKEFFLKHGFQIIQDREHGLYLTRVKK